MKVGFVEAFTGHYRSSRMIARFLELMGVEVVRSGITTPAILEAGTTLASADFCVPLRVYVGHVHRLLADHPDLDFLLAPNVLSEDGKSSTCAKYRDIGGVAMRSLWQVTDYFAAKAGCQAGCQTGFRASDGRLCRFPTVLMPDIRKLDPLHARNVCYDVYADIVGWPRAAKGRLLLSKPMRARLFPELHTLERAARQAYEEAVAYDDAAIRRMEQDPGKPRLALVGRAYLVQDPTVSCDAARWFARRGVSVISVDDVPRSELRVDDVQGFYDSHRELEAFVRWCAETGMDGAIVMGSFGCHPDAFQLDHLVCLAQGLGLAAWPIRFDESSAYSGFYTRYETILSFLEQRRDLRLRRSSVAGEVCRARRIDPFPDKRAGIEPQGAQPAAVPVITWPDMGEILNCVVKEFMWQLGLQGYTVPPASVAEREMLLGNDRYTEACCPFALATGSLRHSLNVILEELEASAAAGEGVEPRRVVVLMLRGEGPCTFGWYSIAQNELLKAEYGERFARGGHTLQMSTSSMDDLSSVFRRVCPPGTTGNLAAVLSLFDRYNAPSAHWLQRALAALGIGAVALPIAAHVWAKLRVAERLRERMLIHSAHELERGSVARAYWKAMEQLEQAHTLPAMCAALRRGLRLLNSVPHDTLARPRVVAVGEIYVLLASYANRGTIMGLMGREGLEVVEGISLSKYILHSAGEIVRRAVSRTWPARPIRRLLERCNVHILVQRLRDGFSRPFLLKEVGGEGVPTVAAARRAVEDGVDGIVHVHPFKCMPEAIAKDALKELAEVYGVRYLALSFDRETEIERLRTEVSTYASVLSATRPARLRPDECRRRRLQGAFFDRALARYRLGRHTS